MDPLLLKSLGCAHLYKQQYVHEGMAGILRALAPDLTYHQTFPFHACASFTEPHDISGILRIACLRSGLPPPGELVTWAEATAFVGESPTLAALFLRSFARLHGVKSGN